LPCLVRTAVGELRVLADYAALVADLQASDESWIELQELDAVQTRHLVRRSAILSVTELVDEGPARPAPARIIGGR
jgi:hypothetical protein